MVWYVLVSNHHLPNQRIIFFVAWILCCFQKPRAGWRAERSKKLANFYACFLKQHRIQASKQQKKHKSLNNPFNNWVLKVRRPRRVAAAVPETSLGAKTPFTRSYTVREPDHLEIYAFINSHNLLQLYSTTNKKMHISWKWYTVCIPCA